MVLVHAAHLAAAGHHVCIRSNVVNTVFHTDPRIVVEPLSVSGKIGTIFSALLEKQDSDLVVADIIPLACLLFFRNPSKVVFFAQGYDISYFKNPILKYFISCLYYLGMTIMKIPVIAVSNELAGFLRKWPVARVEVVENGVDTTLFYSDKCDELILLKNGRKAVLILSRKDPCKGFDVALRIVEKLQIQMKDSFEVWTVGEPCPGMFTSCIHQDFGYVKTDKLRKIISCADIFLYPSRVEGFPLMVLEAFVCKCPVVTTDAVPYAKHLHNAMVSRVEDVNSMNSQVIKLFSDQNLAARLVAEGAAYAEHCSIHEASVRFEKVLCSLQSST
jgi:glycosyltransferase involved in cell wall biosynthesis